MLAVLQEQCYHMIFLTLWFTHLLISARLHVLLQYWFCFILYIKVKKEKLRAWCNSASYVLSQLSCMYRKTTSKYALLPTYTRVHELQGFRAERCYIPALIYSHTLFPMWKDHLQLSPHCTYFKVLLAYSLTSLWLSK